MVEIDSVQTGAPLNTVLYTGPREYALIDRALKGYLNLCPQLDYSLHI